MMVEDLMSGEKLGRDGKKQRGFGDAPTAGLPEIQCESRNVAGGAIKRTLRLYPLVKAEKPYRV
jgi:hypothetical protein